MIGSIWILTFDALRSTKAFSNRLNGFYRERNRDSISLLLKVANV